MPSSVFMTLIEAEPSTIKNSPQAFSVDQPLVDPQLREVAAATPMTSSKNSEQSLHQEVQEASLDSENNLESWTTTTVDPSISTSSPRP